MAKKKSERSELIWRLVVLVISGIILELWGYLITALAIINWLVVLFSGKRNKDIAMFCEYFNTEFYRFLKYLTGVTNERPFPFSNMTRLSKFEK